MYLDKKALIVVGLFAAVVVGLLAWNLVAVGEAKQAARDAATAAAAAASASKPQGDSGGTLTRTDVEDALGQMRTDVASTLIMVRGVRDDIIAIRSTQPDLKPIEHFLRFSGAYRELLLEELARRAKVDIGATRTAVEKMFEGQGGKPPGWFWGPVPAAQ